MDDAALPFPHYYLLHLSLLYVVNCQFYDTIVSIVTIHLVSAPILLMVLLIVLQAVSCVSFVALTVIKVFTC